MEKAVLLVGQLPDNHENYQLLVGLGYVTAIYDGINDREEFYDQVGEVFAQKLGEGESSLELVAYNGLKINPETSNNERIPEINQGLVYQLTDIIRDKLNERNIETFQAPPKKEMH
jgi:hypothetical protein